MENGDKIIVQLEKLSKDTVWTTQRIVEHLHSEVTDALQKATERAIQASPIRFEPLTDQSLVDEHARPPKRLVLDQLVVVH